MFILDTLNTRKVATTKHSPYTVVFGEKPNNLNNINFGDSYCPMEVSVESLLHEIETVQSKVPPDHNKNNPSVITPNSYNDNEHIPKTKPAPQKFYKKAKPVPTPHVHTEKPIPKPHPKPSQSGDLPNMPIDIQTTSSTKDGSDKKHINLSDSLQDKINIK